MDLFPEIPESLEGLSTEQLTELRDGLRAGFEALRERREAGEFVTAEVLEAARVARAAFDEVTAILDRPGQLDELIPEPEAEVEETEEPELADETGDDAGDEEGDADLGDATSDADDSDPGDLQDRDNPAPTGDRQPERHRTHFRAARGLRTHGAGETIESDAELAMAMWERSQDISLAAGDTVERFHVASAEGEFGEEFELSEQDVIHNMRILKAPDALVAAGCALNEPYYELGCMSSLERPVLNSLRRFRAPRGGVSVHQSPTLSDITDGFGAWTFADDANPVATKTPCATIACPDTEDFEWQGIYMCLEVSNMTQKVFPELVDSYKNRLGSLHARFAETQLLDAMIGAPNTISLLDTVAVPADTSLDALPQLLSAIGRTIVAYRESERYSNAQRWDLWMHRYVRDVVRDGYIKRDPANEAGAIAAADSAITRGFAALGVTVHWVMDTPTVAAALEPAAIADGAAAPDYPDQAWWLLAPQGNLAELDGGSLTYGVAPGNLYRDTTTNTRNVFQIFQETFEGIIEFGCKNVYGLTTICPTGSLVAPHTAVTCA